MFFWFFVFKKIEFTKKIILVNLILVSHDDRSSNESFDGHYCKYFVQKKKNFSSRLEYHLTNLTRQFFFRHFLPKSEDFEHARHGRDFGRSV